MVRFSSKPAQKKPVPCCCCHEETKPTDGDDRKSDPPPAGDCFCHVDSALPPHPEFFHLASAGHFVAILDLAPLSLSGLGQTADPHVARSPPLQILHCVWTC